MREEHVPNFACPGALEEQVVVVFNLITEGTGGGGCKPVPEASLVCGETTTLSKLTENLALQGSLPEAVVEAKHLSIVFFLKNIG
jgi:hypothetical protein